MASNLPGDTDVVVPTSSATGQISPKSDLPPMELLIEDMKNGDIKVILRRFLKKLLTFRWKNQSR